MRSLFRSPRFLALAMIGVASLSPLSAQACQLMCFLTVTKYTGSQVGGLAGGDAKCAAEYSGFKFLRNSSMYTMNVQPASQANNGIYNELSSNGGNSSPYTFAWVGDSGSAHTSSVSCTNFTSNSGSGPIIGAYSSNIYSAYAPCNIAAPLMCCNM